LERSLPRNESSTGANVPRNESSWNLRSRGTKVPQERKFQGANVPWNESSTERKFSLWSFRSRERKCRGMKRPGIDKSIFFSTEKVRHDVNINKNVTSNVDNFSVCWSIALRTVSTAGIWAGVKCEVRGGKMRGTGARYQCEALGNLRGWNVRGTTNNWRSRHHYRM